MTEKIFEINDKPISVNQMRQGRTFLTQEYKDFKRSAVIELLFQKSNLKHVRDDSKEICVELWFELTTANSSDIDGVIKCTLDAGTEAGLWRDDRYIQRLIVNKKKALKNKVIIKIINNYDEKQ